MLDQTSTISHDSVQQYPDFFALNLSTSIHPAHSTTTLILKKKRKFSPASKLIPKVLGFLGGAVVKNPPANAGDTGSSPGPGRSHMPRSN